MKKLVMFMAASAIAMGFAVKSNAQISVGFGYANQQQIRKTVSVLDDGETGKSWDKGYKNMNGFYVEAAYNFDLMSLSTGVLSLQPGVRYSLFTQKNDKSLRNIKSEAYSQKIRGVSKETDHVLDIPVNVKYSYELVPGLVNAYAFAGPVFSFGLAYNYVEKSKGNGSMGDETYKIQRSYKENYYTGKWTEKNYDNDEKKVVPDNGEDDSIYNMFDIKLGLGIGATISEKVDVKFGYNIGLLNRGAKSTDEYKRKAHFNVLYFGVAYNF